MIRFGFRAGLAGLALLAGCGGNPPVRAPASSGMHAGAKADHQSRIPRGASWYRVKKGDTLIGIAWRAGIDYRRLARWNGLRPPYVIYPGQKLRLKPPPRRVAAAAKPDRAASTGPSSSHSTTHRRPQIRRHRTAGRHGLHWRWPVQGRVIGTFARSDPGRTGIDIAVSPGTPVQAAESGTVAYAGSGLVGWGQLIIIRHNNEFLSAYAHNRRLLVKEGQKVKRGQHISDTGTDQTGRSLLHFEIRRNGTPVNPLAYLPGR